MKRFAFAVGVLAIAAVASTAARADFAVIKFKDGSCRAWMDSKMGPTPPDAKFIATGLKSWDAAVKKSEWATKHHRCKS